jgi:hypothetical protein
MWISILLLFFSGVAVGAAGTGYYIRNHIIRKFVRGGPANPSKRIIYRLTRDMDLTDSQRGRIDKIIEKMSPEFEVIAENFSESIKEIADREIGMIKEVLTEEQRPVFDKRFEEFKKRMDERIPGHKPGWGRRHKKFPVRRPETDSPADSSQVRGTGQ